MLIAVAVIRVSQPKGREGESFSSPQDQLDRIEELCAEQGWHLPEENVFYEMKVSGDAPLEERTGLNPAVMKILTGSAKVLVGAFSERLWWSHEVRAQVLRLVTAAGGEVWAADAGKLSGQSAAEDFSGEVRTSADRFSRRQNKEKSRTAVERAVSRGVVPFSQVPPGLALDEENRVVTTDEIGIAREAHELRDQDTTIEEVRLFLRDNRIERSFHGTQTMLGNPLYAGEIRFGSLENLSAHEPAIDPALVRRVREMKVIGGRRAKSQRILARLGILVCEHGSRFVVGTQKQNGRNYPFYRLPSVDDRCCERILTISARIAEDVVVSAAKARAVAVEGRASADTSARTDALQAEADQAKLDAAIRGFAGTGLEDEPAAIERLSELTRIRDLSRAKAEHSRNLRSALTVTVADWDRLTLSARRNLIKATIRRAVVGPVVRGYSPASRITVDFFGE